MNFSYLKRKINAELAKYCNKERKNNYKNQRKIMKII